MTLLLTLSALAAEGAAAAGDVGSGRITGGGFYVQLAYGITWAVLLGYVLSLWLRHPRGEA